MTQAENVDGNRSLIQACQKFVKSDFGKYLIGTYNCFGWGKSGHRLRYCPSKGEKGINSRLTPFSSFSLGALKWNWIYTLQTRHDHKGLSLFDPICSNYFMFMFMIFFTMFIFAVCNTISC